MKKSPSFSIVEILIVLGLGSILLAGSYQLYFLATKTLSKNSNKYEIRQNARIVLERISRDLRQSQEIITSLPADESAAPISSIKFQDGHGTDKIEYIEYYLQDNRIYKRLSHYSFTAEPTVWVKWSDKDSSNQSPLETVDLNELIAENINDLRFWGSTVVGVSVTAQKFDDTENFKTIILGRNI